MPTNFRVSCRFTAIMSQIKPRKKSFQRNKRTQNWSTNLTNISNIWRSRSVNSKIQAPRISRKLKTIFIRERKRTRIWLLLWLACERKTMIDRKNSTLLIRRLLKSIYPREGSTLRLKRCKRRCKRWNLGKALALDFTRPQVFTIIRKMRITGSQINSDETNPEVA